MTLTPKETTLLKDLISQEQLCIEKYDKNAADACDGNLKNLFGEISKVEKQHLNTLNQINSGTVPQVNNSADKPLQDVCTATYSAQDTSPNRQKDKYLCSDTLAIEKHVSSLYNTSIFEFTDTNIRNVLNHIQREEQDHGEKLYNYMKINGMYS